MHGGGAGRAHGGAGIAIGSHVTIMYETPKTAAAPATSSHPAHALPAPMHNTHMRDDRARARGNLGIPQWLKSRITQPGSGRPARPCLPFVYAFIGERRAAVAAAAAAVRLDLLQRLLVTEAPRRRRSLTHTSSTANPFLSRDDLSINRCDQR